MASDSRKGYTLRLELRDDAGTVVGEVSAKFSSDALRGLIQEATSGRGEGRDASGSRAREPRERAESRHRAQSRSSRSREEHPSASRGEARAMSSEQRKFLFRLAYDLGFARSLAAQKVLDTLGVSRFEEVSHGMASRAIDTLKQQVDIRREGSNGAQH